MMQFIPFVLAASLPIAERLPALSKVVPRWQSHDAHLVTEPKQGITRQPEQAVGQLRGNACCFTVFAYVNLLMLCQCCAV